MQKKKKKEKKKKKKATSFVFWFGCHRSAGQDNYCFL